MPADTDQPTPAVTQADRDIAVQVLSELVNRAPAYSITSIEREHFDRSILAISGLLRHRTNSEPRPAGDLREVLVEAMSPHGWLGEQCLTDIMAVFATHSPAPMADPMKVGLAIQSAWGEDDMGFDNTLPPIEFSDAELRHLGAAAIRAVAHPSTQEGADRG